MHELPKPIILFYMAMIILAFTIYSLGKTGYLPPENYDKLSKILMIGLVALWSTILVYAIYTKKLKRKKK